MHERRRFRLELGIPGLNSTCDDELDCVLSQTPRRLPGAWLTAKEKFGHIESASGIGFGGTELPRDRPCRGHSPVMVTNEIACPNPFHSRRRWNAPDDEVNKHA